MGILSNTLINDGGNTKKSTTTSKPVDTGNGVLNKLLNFADRAKLSQQEELARKIANAGKTTSDRSYLPPKNTGPKNAYGIADPTPVWQGASALKDRLSYNPTRYDDSPAAIAARKAAHEANYQFGAREEQNWDWGAEDSKPMGPVWKDKLLGLHDKVYPVPESGTYTDKYPAPYVPGISDNPAVDGSTSEVYRKQNEDGTPNKTYFPNPDGGYYRGPYADDTDFKDPIGDGSMQDIRDELSKLGDPNYSDYAKGNSSRPGLRSAEDMANYHGIDYNQANMRAILDKATQEKYNNLDTEHARNQRDFYNMTSQSAYQLQDALMRGDRGAAMSNATRGTGVSERLAALHDVGAANAEGATEIGRLRADLVGQREADLAANAERALTMYNELGINLGTLSAREQDALAVAYNAELANSATRYQADMNFKATLRQVLGNLEAQKSANASQLELERMKQKHEGNIMNHPFWQQQNS